MKKQAFGLLSIILIANTLLGVSLSKDVSNSSLVVYNGNIGLVHEERLLELNKADDLIVYKGVANTIDIDSVNVKLPKGVNLKSQQYRFDKLTQAKLLNSHIGKKIQVKVLKDAKNFKTLNATLLSHSSSQAIVKTENSQIITVQTKDIIFKNIPDELITQPSLVWNIRVDKNIKTNMEIDYLIKNISWKSDYILNLTKNSANLSGMISINNRSGKSFKDVSLNVLAGEINLAQAKTYRKNIAHAPMSTQDKSVAHYSHEGYHLYTVPFKVDLAKNEKTQIKFIDLKDIKIDREYSVKLSNPLYAYNNQKYNVEQFINLNKLEIALPKGIVRSYSKHQKQNILLGLTNIDHTPKNTPIKLKIGTNFDLKVEQNVIKKRDNKYQFNSTLEYILKNNSEKKKLVEILVPFNRHNKSEINTDKIYKFKKGNLISFEISIDANSTQKFQVNYISKK